MMVHSIRRGSVGAALIAVLGVVAALLPAAAQSQEALQVEVRAGITAGNHSTSAAGFDFAPRLSFDLLFRRQVAPGIGAYGGFLRTSFGCNQPETFCHQSGDAPALKLVGNHIVVGGEWSPAGMADAPARPWVRAGVMYGSAGMTRGADNDPETHPDPEMGIGIHTAVGLSVGTGSFLFVPSVTRRQMAASQPAEGGGGSADDATASAYSIDLAIALRIGGGS
ncbi:MAG: hypothetical protein OXG58_12105 [Gemmatimonadetes bacterium]|nr:hypothetical protein [Gemmatimonadota bacterium]MCY3944331.1 hypothetical protein [Gemmatimonadota bacterium]